MILKCKIYKKDKIKAMKNWKSYIMAVGLLFGVSSCVFEEHVPEPAVADAEMRLSVSISSGTRAGDPGTDHGERNADWETLGVYVVYTNGRVLSFSIPQSEFKAPYSKVFSVFEGTAQVYAVAFPSGHTPPVCNTVAEVQNMRTLDISKMSGDNNAKQKYIQNIFSGISDSEDIVKDRNNRIDVTCTRLAAKIDVQWDAQGAYENGKFTKASMSKITLEGLAQGYVFPSEVSNPTYTTTQIVAAFTAGDAISERNGRTYFYTFPGVTNPEVTNPGVKDAINFTVSYDDGSDNLQPNVHSYTATFDEPSNPNTWYKVNIQVNGTTASATSTDHNLVLTQTQAGN